MPGHRRCSDTRDCPFLPASPRAPRWEVCSRPLCPASRRHIQSDRDPCSGCGHEPRLRRLLQWPPSRRRRADGLLKYHFFSTTRSLERKLLPSMGATRLLQTTPGRRQDRDRTASARGRPSPRSAGGLAWRTRFYPRDIFRTSAPADTTQHESIGCQPPRSRHGSAAEPLVRPPVRWCSPGPACKP